MSLLIDLLRGSNCTLMNKMKKNLQSNILLLPALIAGFFCYLFPILIAFGKSFFLGTGTDFVGIQNYVDLFENEAFSLAVRNLFHLWAIIVPVNLVIGIFIAEVYIKLRKEKLCLFFLVPSILPAACVVTIASSILQKSLSQWGETPVAFYVFLIIVLWKITGILDFDFYSCYKIHRIRDHRCRHARWSQPSTMFLVYKASNHKEFSIDLWNLDDLQ
mgnify:CR=1 FL=1